MTFSDIVDFGIKNGFSVNKKEGCNFISLVRKDGIKVELTFPEDKLSSTLNEGVNIDWEYRLLDNKTNQELFKDWIDIYRGTPEEKINDVKNQILEFINKITTLEIRIEEKFVFSIFGLKIFKYKVLLFKTNDCWTEQKNCP